MELKKTISSIFLVPTLKIHRDVLKKCGFINAFIADCQKESHENSVYLLFRPPNLDIFDVFLSEEYEKDKDIIEDYDYEGGWIVLVYKLNKDYLDDIDLIKEGRYSRTSKEFQKLFPKVIKIIKNGLHKDEISLQYRIFNKTDDLREYWENKINIDFSEDMEVWEGWEEDGEILNIKKIKEAYDRLKKVSENDKND